MRTYGKWRRRGAGGKVPMTFLAVAALVVGVWLWQGAYFTRLTGQRVASPASQPALEPMTPPAVETATAEPAPESLVTEPADPVEVEPVIKPLAPPTTQPTELTADPIKARSELQAGLAACEHKKLIDARTHLNAALHAGLTAEQAIEVRTRLAELADQTLFSRRVYSRDPLTEHYKVQSGDSLARIARKYKITDDLLADINRLANKNVIHVGQRLKVLNGPFHASVSKADHELHVYLGDLYVKTMPVALGADGSTPTGRWLVFVRQENPEWVSPEGQRWHADDPENPIGEYWLGLEGLAGDAVGRTGFGIHGTIEPETIGQDVSLGCVRMADDDIALTYKLLVPGWSYVNIYE